MVESYHGKSYVAYLDISGFAEMMKDLDSAKTVLNDFYTTIFDYCETQNTGFPRISMIAASDCCVLFTRKSGKSDRLSGLSLILDFVRQVNRKYILTDRSQPFMTTCSVAYGRFDYEDRRDSADLRKNYLFGMPYLKVVLDQNQGKPKIRASECRLLKQTIPNLRMLQNESPSSLILRRGRRHYFYWMLNTPNDQSNFDRDYADAYKNRKKDKYFGVIQVLQNYVRRSVQGAYHEWNQKPSR